MQEFIRRVFIYCFYFVKYTEHEANWKQSNVTQEALSPKPSSELIEETDNAKSLESVDCTQKNKESECNYVNNLSTILQQMCEQSGKKKTPMCLVNELARHHKVKSYQSQKFHLNLLSFVILDTSPIPSDRRIRTSTPKNFCCKSQIG